MSVSFGMGVAGGEGTFAQNPHTPPWTEGSDIAIGIGSTIQCSIRVILFGVGQVTFPVVFNHIVPALFAHIAHEERLTVPIHRMGFETDGHGSELQPDSACLLGCFGRRRCFQITASKCQSGD